MLRYYKAHELLLQDGNEAFPSKDHLNTHVYLHQLDSIRRIFSILTAIIFLLFSPLYGILSATSGIYSQEYAWSISGAFKSGSAASGVLFTFWSFMLLFVNHIISIAKSDSTTSAASKTTLTARTAAAAATTTTTTTTMLTQMLLCSIPMLGEVRIPASQSGKKEAEDAKYDEEVAAEMASDAAFMKRRILLAYYDKYNPAKKPSIRDSMRVYRNNEQEFFTKLKAQYGSSPKEFYLQHAKSLNLGALDDADVEDVIEEPSGREGQNALRFLLLNSLRLAIIAIINVVVVMTVNISYVYISATQRDTIQALAKLGTVVFKLLWVSVGLQRLLDTSKLHFGMKRAEVSAFEDRFFYSKPLLFVWFLTFNNLIAPVLATALSDSQCFATVFVPAPAIFSKYSVFSCRNYNPLTLLCVNVDSLDVQFNYVPTFSYHYTCAGTFLRNYSRYAFAHKGFVFILRSLPLYYGP